MNRGIALFVAVAVVVGLTGVAAAGPVGTVVAQDDSGTEDEALESNETAEISPGEHLSGVIGVQNAEVGGEVASRAFEVGLDRSETPEERADVVAQQLDRNEQRLDEIEQRQQELRERRDAGELSQGAYAARMAETAARAEIVRRDTNRSAVVAGGIPETVRVDRGLDSERLETLRDRAGDLSGPEVAAIARGIAGTDVGGPMASERRGPPDRVVGNESDPPGAGAGSPGDVGGLPSGVGESPIDRSDAEGGTVGDDRGNEPNASDGDVPPPGDASDNVDATEETDSTEPIASDDESEDLADDSSAGSTTDNNSDDLGNSDNSGNTDDPSNTTESDRRAVSGIESIQRHGGTTGDNSAEATDGSAANTYAANGDAMGGQATKADQHRGGH